jgi:hypothetical protein
MIEILRHLLTGQDNETHDIVHWCGLVSFLIAIGLVLYSVVWKGQAFSLQDFGTGIGLLMVSIGGALKLKEKVEP